MRFAALQPRAGGSSWPRELVAGTTTFATMAYIIVVNPKILEAAGIPFGPSMVATILSAAVGTLLMGFYANRPFAIAPYMGLNAFVAFTVVQGMGHAWQTALGAVFVSGVLFTAMSFFRARAWLAEWVPRLEKVGVPCAPINDLHEVKAHVQTAALNMVQPVPEIDLGLMGLPLSLDGARPVIRARAPKLGEHCETVPGVPKVRRRSEGRA